MELTPEQVAAARARGCFFVPASADQVARLTMQRRIFTLHGAPHLATRGEGGFMETHATVRLLVGDHASGEPGAAQAETTEEAERADAEAAAAMAAERPASSGGGAQVVRRRAAARPRWRGAKSGA
jgi:hypothetical protein